MDLSDLKQMLNKVFKGCGCMSIAFCGLLLVVGLFADDDESKSETDNSDQKENTEQVEKKDSVIVNEPLEGDP